MSALKVAEISSDEKRWFERAQTDETLLFLAMLAEERIVGQVVLHDIDRERQKAMIAYHVFQSGDRRHGHATAAIAATCRHAVGALALRRVVAITSLDNVASRRAVASAGFRETGPAREGPHLVCYEWVAEGSRDD